MRRRKFVPPNFKCRVTPTGPGAPAFDQLEQGATLEEVKARVTAQYPGAAVTVAPYDFEEWKAKAREETKRAIKAHEEGKDYDFKDAIWGLLKEYLFRLFDKKCAYCESTRAAVTKGAVEHYRPKGAVKGIDHPGYYWLAYHHENYVPACPPCNTNKGSSFPLADEASRVTAPGADPFDGAALAGEKPLLFNLLAEDPFPQSLTFNLLTGADGLPRLVTARPLDKRAEQSIEILKLNRIELSEERAEELTRVLQSWGVDILRPASGAIAAVLDGRARYSAACAATLRALIAHRQQDMGLEAAPAAAGRGGG
jgi:hypothetical protein